MKADILQKDEQFANAEKLYLEALANDANCQRALVGIAFGYMLQAMDMKDDVETLIDNKKNGDYNRQIVSLYTKSLPYLEKYLLLNIDKNRELEAIEKELKELE